MHKTMRRCQAGDLFYYTCDRLPVRHAFTTKSGGVSEGIYKSLNLGFRLGDSPENVHKNYEILADALHIPAQRLTMTKQIHEDQISVVTEETVGTGLQKPVLWESDALVTNLPDTPLVGFYADCVVTLLYDPVSLSCGVCHAGWRGTAKGILPKTLAVMEKSFGAQPKNIIAVLGPSIGPCCFETDADVPEAMEAALGGQVRPYVQERGVKFHVDLQGINAHLLRQAGMKPDQIIISDLCTCCHSDVFWSHRATHGKRGVQAGVICL